jgi:hypothetical protein
LTPNDAVAANLEEREMLQLEDRKVRERELHDHLRSDLAVDP